MNEATPSDLGLSKHRSTILDAYTTRLRQLNSPLADERNLRHFLELVDKILTDCDESVRSGQFIPRESPLFVTRPIDDDYAVRVHPTELIRAGAALFDTMFTEIRRLLAGHNDRLATVASTLQHGVFVWLQAQSSSYDAFLLNRIKEHQSTHRRTLARAIHDQLGANLSLALRRLELYELAASGGSPDPHKLSQVRESLATAMDIARDLSHDLRSKEPLSSIRTALTTFTESVGAGSTKVDIRVNGDEGWIPPSYRSEVFLILREALRNAFSHAETPEVVVIIDVAPHEVRAVVGDHGKGFDAHAASTVEQSSGLVSMRERAELLGGALRISSQPPYGTNVEFRIPLPEQHHGEQT